MEQYTSGYDAIRRLLEGVSSHEVARFLMDEGHWPPMRPESAAARVRANCNPDSDQYWKYSELIALMAWCQRFDPLYHACDVLGLERPGPRGDNPELLEKLRELDEIEARRGEVLSEIRALSGEGSAPDMGPTDQLGAPESVTRPRFRRG